MKENRHKRFMEREAKMRETVRKTKFEGPDIHSQAKDGSECDAISDKATLAETKGEMLDAAEEKLSVKLVRPMWALTEEQAEMAVERAEYDEADDLLDFANSLDFDKYISDSEVSALIENVRSRIAELETNQHATTKNELNEHTINKALSKSKRLTAENLRSLSDKAECSSINGEDDCVSVVRSLMESDAGKSVGAIHSHKSLAAVAGRSKNALVDIGGCIEEAVPQPLVIKHTDDAGARLEGKNCVSNLPYMHRNPAV